MAVLVEDFLLKVIIVVLRAADFCLEAAVNKAWGFGQHQNVPLLDRLLREGEHLDHVVGLYPVIELVINLLVHHSEDGTLTIRELEAELDAFLGLVLIRVELFKLEHLQHEGLVLERGRTRHLYDAFNGACCQVFHHS